MGSNGTESLARERVLQVRRLMCFTKMKMTGKAVTSNETIAMTESVERCMLSPLRELRAKLKFRNGRGSEPPPSYARYSTYLFTFSRFCKACHQCHYILGSLGQGSAGLPTSFGNAVAECSNRNGPGGRRGKISQCGVPGRASCLPSGSTFPKEHRRPVMSCEILYSTNHDGHSDQAENLIMQGFAQGTLCCLTAPSAPRDGHLFEITSALSVSSSSISPSYHLQRLPYAAVIKMSPTTGWDAHKNLLERLYVGQNWTLKEVLNYMKDNFEFAKRLVFH